MSRIRFKTVRVGDWPKFLSVVFIVGTLTVVAFTCADRVVGLFVSLLTGGSR